MDKKKFKWRDILPTKVFCKLPKELDKECTKEEFHQMMTSHNSDIPIEEVKFRNHPSVSMGK